MKKKVALTISNEFITNLQTVANEYYQGISSMRELKKEMEKINDETMDAFNDGRITKEQLAVYMKTVDQVMDKINKEGR